MESQQSCQQGHDQSTQGQFQHDLSFEWFSVLFYISVHFYFNHIRCTSAFKSMETTLHGFYRHVDMFQIKIYQIKISVITVWQIYQYQLGVGDTTTFWSDTKQYEGQDHRYQYFLLTAANVQLCKREKCQDLTSEYILICLEAFPFPILC